MSVVTARFTDAAGVPAVGHVMLAPAFRAGNDDPRIITEKRVVGVLVDGVLSLDVLPTDDPSWTAPDGTTVLYLVEERIGALPIRSYFISVPSEGIDLAEVAP